MKYYNSHHYTSLNLDLVHIFELLDISISSHFPTEIESRREKVTQASHCWGWTLCKGPSVPWHVGASTLLYHWWFSSFCGIHESEPETSVICFSLSDKEQPSQPSQLGFGLSLFQPQC
jgi:hypothetical protein